MDTIRQSKECQNLFKRSVALGVDNEKRIQRYKRLLEFQFDEDIFFKWKNYLDDIENDRISNNIVFEEPSQEELKGNLAEVGVTPKGLKFGIDEIRLRMFVFIAGETRTGKTTLLYKLIIQLAETNLKIFILDLKGDYSGLLRLIKNTVVIRARELYFNDLLPCQNIQPQDYFASYSENFSQTMGFMQGSAFYLNEQLSKLYALKKNMTYMTICLI